MEVWKDVVGYEGLYKVSDLGRVVSERFGKTRLMKLSLKSGYCVVGLTKNKRQRVKGVHVLVLEAFVSPRPEGTLCCHGDGNRTNNQLSNLRWDSPYENYMDAVRHGTAAWLPNVRQLELNF